jgi:hypothetical protein
MIGARGTVESNLLQDVPEQQLLSDEGCRSIDLHDDGDLASGM